MAKIKQTEETTTRLEGKVVGKQRTAEQIVKQWHTVDTIEQLNLNESEIEMLIDHGTKIEERRRSIDKEVKSVVEPIKDILLQSATAVKWKHKEGSDGKCDIGPSTKTLTGTASELYKLLQKEKKAKLFNSLLTVRVTDAKKFLGEDILFKSGFFRSERREYGTVSLKPRK
jgi:hypothetical protein